MNESLMKELESKREALLGMVSDQGAAKAVIEDMLSAQRQMDITPTELIIPEADVVKEYPITGAISVVRCETCIFLHSTCFWVVVKPTLANNFKGGALYEMLEWYCDYKDTRDEYTKAQQKTFDLLCSAIVTVLTLPLDVFTNLSFMSSVATYIVEARNIYYEWLNNEASVPNDETYEDTLKNLLYEQSLVLSKDLIEELDAMSKKVK